MLCFGISTSSPEAHRKKRPLLVSEAGLGQGPEPFSWEGGSTLDGPLRRLDDLTGQSWVLPGSGSCLALKALGTECKAGYS